jgi:hypothetical protein
MQPNIKFFLIAFVAIAAALPCAAQLPPLPELLTGFGGAPAKQDTANTFNVKSMFFTQQQMARIDKALDIYSKYTVLKQNGNEGEDFLKQLESKDSGSASVQQKPKYYTYPQFFLSSLAYHSPGDWSIIVNNQKISSLNVKTPSEIQVESIDKDKVLLLWTPAKLNMEKINEKWNGLQSGSVQVNGISGTVNFALHANQTFSSFTMQVMEGKVLPVVEVIQPISPVIDTTDSIAPVPVKQDLPPANSPIMPSK